MRRRLGFQHDYLVIPTGGERSTRLSLPGREASEDLGLATPLQTGAAYLSAIGRKPFAARFV